MKARAVNWLLMGILICTGPVVARGQTLLRWKLKPGEKLGLTVQQETESQVAFSGKSATTKIELIVELQWLVSAADDKQIQLKQTIKGIQLKLQSPQGGRIEYDSAAEARPTGQARDVADTLMPLIGAEVNITMTPRGEVTAAEAANSTAEQLLSSQAKPGEAGVSRGSIERLLKQSLVVLPETEVTVGDEWRDTSPIAVAAGDFQQVKTYRLAGLTEEGGQSIARLEMTAELDPDGATPPGTKLPPGKRPAVGKLAVKSHQQSGTVQFAVEAGRVTQAEQTQKLVTERPYRETTIVVTLSSRQTTKVRSAQ
jgi:hypothetical protein